MRIRTNTSFLHDKLLSLKYEKLHILLFRGQIKNNIILHQDIEMANPLHQDIEMAAASFEKLTIEQLIDQDPKFCAWILKVISSIAKDWKKVLKEGNPFRVFLIETEEKRMDKYLLEGGDQPE